MRISPNLKAVFVVAILAVALFLLWGRYSEFLMSGRRPPLETQILNEIDKNGIPYFKLKDLNGIDLEISRFKGKIVIINFWASWCDPCVAEFPSLVKLLKRFNGDIQLVAISADFELVDIQNFLKALQIKNDNLHIAWDKDLEIAKKFGTFKLPESYIVGKKGEFIRKISGVDDWATNEAFQFFDDLLKRD